MIVPCDNTSTERPVSLFFIVGASIERLLDRLPRLICFGAVGSTCALFQLVVLSALVHFQLELHLANTLAFILSTQLNFGLSSLITWRDRRPPSRSPVTDARRLAGYNVLALGSLLINQTVFALALHFASYLLAGLSGILAGMFLTYAVSGRFLFRRALATAAA